MNKMAGVILVGFVFCIQLGMAQVTTGTISGVMHDATGAVVPGVSVTVRNVETGVSRTVSTDAQGQYRAPNLSLGRYEVQASVTGFQTAVRSGISLSVGQEAAVNFTLEVGQVAERVEVTGEAPLVEATRSDVSGVIEQSQVTDLPLNGRNYLQLAQLQTGIVAVRNSRNISFGGRQSVLATSGSQSTSGLYLLDGTDITDYLFATTPGGASGMAIGVDMIREFRVLTNSSSAEYGRSSGGVLTVVSKSGTNQLEGTALWFHRNDNMDTRNFFDGKKPEFKRNQFGGTLGGPIIKDKTFFLGSFEGLREAVGRTSVALVPSLRAREGFVPIAGGGENNVGVAPNVRPFLNLYPLPTGQTFTNGTAEARPVETDPTEEDFFSVRIDHVLSEKDTLFGRYTFRDGVTSDAFGSTAVPGFAGVGENRTQYVSAEETRVFSPTVLNTFRVSFNRNARGNPTEPPPPELCMSLLPSCTGMGPLRVGGLNQLGHRVSRPAFSVLNVYQAQDSVYLTRGSHSLKLGTDFVRYQSNYNYPQSFNGVYDFSTLADFLAGRPRQFSGALPGSDGYRGMRWTTIALFAQDEWRVLPSFTLNLGLRYEFYSNPTEVNGKVSTLLEPLKDTQVSVVATIFDGNPGSALFAPRFGFAWDPLKNGKLAVRGGFGVYFDRLHANIYNGLHTNQPFATTVQISNPPFPKALPPGTALPPAGASSYSNSVAPRDFSYPYALQWNFSVQQEIVPSTVVSATYAGSRGIHIVVQGNIDMNQWEFRDGKKFFPVGARQLNPAFSSIGWRESKANSFYHSLQLNLKRRLSQGLQFQTAYTWSKAIDDGSTFGATARLNTPDDMYDLFDLKLGRGLSEMDVRHNFVFSSSYELPFGGGNKLLSGWQLGGIVSLTSGIPFTVLTGFNRTRNVIGGGGNTPPDRVKEVVSVEPRNVDRYFDLNAFALQPAGFFGNAGKNSVIGPGLVNVDFSVLKNFSITERVKLQWRLEMFNIFNRANFATPGDDGASSTIPPLFTDASGIPVPTGGKLRRTTTSSRQIQMGLKINF